MGRSGNVFDKLRVIEQEITKVAGAKHKMGDRWMICCPYHADSNPSATVSVDTNERRVPMGFFGCFGCKKQLKWNDFAADNQLQKFGRNENLSSDDYGDPNAHRESFLGDALGSDEDESEPEDVWAGARKRFPDLNDLEFIDDWPFDEWRDVEVKLLDRVGAKLVKHTDYNRHWIFLPVWIKGVLKGYIRATLDKPKDGKPSYLNAKGGWSHKWGLIYYDYAVKLMRKKGLKTMVLCEGPRDSLRLLKAGIPAVSVLGALNWGHAKRGLLEDAEVEKIILAFDGDKAGWVAARHIYTDVRKFFKTRYLALWNTSPAWNPVTKRFPSDKKLKLMKKQWKADGKKWEELDPFNMPQHYVELIQENLE